MIYLQLFWVFLQIGLFSFGGAYGAIPLIRELVLANNWLSEDTFTYFIAISESTPGPIMVNMATFIGQSQAGLPGAILATVGVVLPSFLIILTIAAFARNLLKNPCIQSVLKGIKPCFIGIILATGLYMIITNAIDLTSYAIRWRNLLITAILLFLSYGSPKLKKRPVSPIVLILFSAGLGMIVYSI